MYLGVLTASYLLLEYLVCVEGELIVCIGST